MLDRGIFEATQHLNRTVESRDAGIRSDRRATIGAIQLIHHAIHVHGDVPINPVDPVPDAGDSPLQTLGNHLEATANALTTQIDAHNAIGNPLEAMRLAARRGAIEYVWETTQEPELFLGENGLTRRDRMIDRSFGDNTPTIPPEDLPRDFGSSVESTTPSHDLSQFPSAPAVSFDEGPEEIPTNHNVSRLLHTEQQRSWGQSLESLRNSTGRSRREIAEATGLSYAALRKIERGERMVTLDEARSIIGALDINTVDNDQAFQLLTQMVNAQEE